MLRRPLELRCFVVLGRKAVAFKPEFVGKINFYLAAVDDMHRHEANAPSIGLLLCRSKQKLTVEDALRNVATPVAVSEFVARLANQIEDELKTRLEQRDDVNED